MLLGCLSLWSMLCFSGCEGGKAKDFSAQGAPSALDHKSLVDAGKEALLLSRFHSFAEFQSLVQVEYVPVVFQTNPLWQGKSYVKLTHDSGYGRVVSILETGVSQKDLLAAKNGGFLGKVGLLLRSPYCGWNRNDLQRVYALSRRRGGVFGEGDVAFFDLAEAMVAHIYVEDKAKMPLKDLTEKGYINTFNHVTAQAFMTTLFSERLADFIADIHERYNMPTLISGNFSPETLADIDYGPVDNYVDMINNEWGQELGKELKQKYQISSRQEWTPILLQNYLNEIQAYFAWSFGIRFKPFSADDEVLLRFCGKINEVLKQANEI